MHPKEQNKILRATVAAGLSAAVISTAVFVLVLYPPVRDMREEVRQESQRLLGSIEDDAFADVFRSRDDAIAVRGFMQPSSQWDSSRSGLKAAFAVEELTFIDRLAGAFDSWISRVMAASFDADLLPGTANTYNLGTSAAKWASINDTLYFSGSNVGIGVAAPASTLQITGGNVYISTPNRGFILKSTGGSCFLMTVNASGNIATSSVTCP